MVRSSPLSLLCLALLVGCTERPAGVPAPRTGLLNWGTACPNLTGTYALKSTRGGWSIGGHAIAQALRRAPAHHDLVTIERLDKDGMVLNTHATAESTRAAFVRWRKDYPYPYALWRHSLRARSTSEGVLLEHEPGKHPDPTKVFRPSYTVEIPGSRYACRNGQVIFQGEEEPDVNSLRSAQVRLSRAADGGLVSHANFSFQRSFSLWCGDSCKPNIQLPDGHKKRWWHAPPAKAPTHAMNWEAWLAQDDRPPAEQQRYQAGTLLRYATTPSSKEPKPGSNPSTPPQVLWVACPVQQRRLEQIVGSAVTLTSHLCDGQVCKVDGEVADHGTLSAALRALDDAGAEGLELAHIEQTEPGKVRFGLRLRPFPTQPPGGCLEN